MNENTTKQSREIIFVLVKPEDPRNVGSAARAMNTMGFDKMRLINPCEHNSGQAKALAHRSRHILEQAQVYPSLDLALEDIDISIATTVRHRKNKYVYHNVKEVPQIIEKKGPEVKKIAIVFGGEKNGLCNEDLLMCDMLSTIPTANPQPSLNLSQAIMVYAHTLSNADCQTIDRRFKEEIPSNYQYNLIKKDVISLINQLNPQTSPIMKTQIQQGLSRLNYEDFHLIYSIQKLMTNYLNDREN